MKLFGIIALTAVIGFTMVACSDDADSSSLDGVWVSNFTVVTINGRNGYLTQMRNLDALWQSAIDKGYIKTKDQCYRNLTKSGYLTWKGQVLTIQRTSASSNVATGTYWRDCTITMAENGRTFQSVSGSVSGTITTNYTRQ